MIDTKDIQAIRVQYNEKSRKKDSANKYLNFFTKNESEHIAKYHSSISGFSPTPLVSLDRLAEAIGVKKILIKDESYRLGLNAFKVLGASYSVGRTLCQKLGLNIEDVTFDYLKSDEVRNKTGQLTFTSATDGNHGRAVAWSATQLGHKVVIFLPKGSVKRRVDAIRNIGAEVHVTDLNYDDTVKFVSKKAEENNWIMIQDTSWEGYEEAPRWIMQGYMTMAGEAAEQIDRIGIASPTHMFLQAGVGSMAAAVSAYYKNIYGRKYPLTITVESKNADCFYKSICIGDGKAYKTDGDLHTIMAGLACGIPNPMAFEILRDFSDFFISCDDSVTARGIRVGGNPLTGDSKIICGESGAVGLGLLTLIMTKDEYSDIRKQMNLNRESIVLLFNTEGDTDPDNYRSIVWDGKYPNL